MTPGQHLADGAAGIALLHLETGNLPAAQAALGQAAADGASTGGGASLYYGAPALAYVLASSRHPGLTRAQAVAAEGTALVTRRRLDAAHRRIDQGERPGYREYDLIGGLTGLGVALRRLGGTGLLREVLTYLVRLAEPLNGLPGWWCRHGPARRESGPPGGHSNHGMAHGISGCLAFLSLTMIDGVTVPGHTRAIGRILQWLDLWQQARNGTWWPQWVTLDDVRRAAPAQREPRRPSWCYGTPGIARAQQLAARATADTARQRTAELAFTLCTRDATQLGRLTTRGLCHGTAGLLATGRRISADALAPPPVDHLLRLHECAADSGRTGFLDGQAGAALAAADLTSSWDACLLLT